MAVRTPLYMAPPVGIEPYKQLNPFTTTMVNQLHEMAGHAFALSPNPRIEINGTNGSAVSGQPFTDTWWSSGSYTTRVDRYSTAAETPNVFKVTDNYSRIRVVYDSVSLPTGDTNNTQYPLYLWDSVGNDIDEDIHFRAMSVADFVDTFVLPVLDQFGGGGQSLAKSGTYYLTTSATPANATLASGTPAAVNNEANVSGYAASSIPTVNNITTNYYVAKVDYSPTTNNLYDDGIYDMPLYFDAGTESIRHHSPTTWANLLNPFLRFYLGGGSSAHTISYNVDGSDGTTNGSVYTDTGIVTAGSDYNTRFVNANDYRTQEFPTGTAVVISQKRFKIHQGPSTILAQFPSGPYSITTDSAEYNTDSVSEFTIFNTGTITAAVTDGDTEVITGLPDTWLVVGSASAYDVRYTYTTNLNGGVLTGPGNGVWLNCGTNRTWSLLDQNNPFNEASNWVYGTLEIRDVATQTIQASTTMYLQADTGS